jgi:hypothetical protein
MGRGPGVTWSPAHHRYTTRRHRNRPRLTGRSQVKVWFVARYLQQDLQVPEAAGFIAVGALAIWSPSPSGAATSGGPIAAEVVDDELLWVWIRRL